MVDRISLIRKQHRGFNPEEISSEEIYSTSIVGLAFDGVLIDIPAGSSITLEGGPGPTSVTLTVMCKNLEIIDEAKYYGD